VKLCKPYRVFAVLVGASVLVRWKVLALTFSLARTKDAYTHILLILPISVTLAILQRQKRPLKPISSVGAGSGLLVLGMAIAVGGIPLATVGVLTSDVRLALEMLSLVTWWIGAFVLCFGARSFRDYAFPLLFLLWLVPVPTFVVNRAVEFLQQGTASFARILMATFGVPVTQDGTILSVPGLSVEVAQECSSIRSSMLLLVSSTLMAYLLLRSFWGRGLVVFAAIPLAIAKNGVRVFTLTVLAAYVDPTVLKSALHRQGGILFFAIALAVLFEIVWLTARLERRHAIASGLKQVDSLSISGMR
jgi:exosortase